MYHFAVAYAANEILYFNMSPFITFRMFAVALDYKGCDIGICRSHFSVITYKYLLIYLFVKTKYVLCKPWL